MGYITFDFACDNCNTQEVLMLDREERDEPQSCTVCGQQMRRMFTANITRASYVDGTKRFAGVKEQRDLEKLKRKARRAGNKEEVARLAAEQKDIRRGRKNDNSKENICKVKDEV